ncbi:hypothetical protein HHK36_021134 [Tetracentron sinense]|uniref:Auxin-responsive protein n=1 Tax=Tetracentron sinense TaxID=13715 RepID=A0A834YP67_TETSI|nr:hypothetical protein HHK36_021134 [Tetracentron sinense]
MNGFDSQGQGSLKRRWQEKSVPTIDNHPCPNSSTFTSTTFLGHGNLHIFPGMVSTVIPPVTVVLEGRSICQRISLHKHASYQSLARALRQMFTDVDEAGEASETDLDLSNAVPGHLIAYEDMEDDLLLAGDLNWEDFVRVTKRIRVLPAKANSRKGREEA